MVNASIPRVHTHAGVDLVSRETDMTASLIRINVKEPDVIQMQSVLSSFLADDDCVFVRKVGKETDEPVMI